MPHSRKALGVQRADAAVHHTDGADRHRDNQLMAMFPQGKNTPASLRSRSWLQARAGRTVLTSSASPSSTALQRFRCACQSREQAGRNAEFLAVQVVSTACLRVKQGGEQNSRASNVSASQIVQCVVGTIERIGDRLDSQWRVCSDA